VTRPAIALVAYALPASETPRRPVGHVAVSDRYVDSLHRAGARVVMLPATASAPPCEPAELLGNLDGLLLIGGGDLDPALYGQVAHEKSYGFNLCRDEMELALASYALAEDLPMLAICRGCQVVNVACGGTLHQHLPDVPTYHVDAHGRPHDLVFAEHSVTVADGSRLEEALGGQRHIARCTSAHHQAVDAVGSGLRVSGRSEDGCIEALEPVGPHLFALAVQWHPEMTAAVDPLQQALFDALVAAAGARRERAEHGEPRVSPLQAVAQPA
jgi:putative glutamine amidotransferase